MDQEQFCIIEDAWHILGADHGKIKASKWPFVKEIGKKARDNPKVDNGLL